MKKQLTIEEYEAHLKKVLCEEDFNEWKRISYEIMKIKLNDNK